MNSSVGYVRAFLGEDGRMLKAHKRHTEGMNSLDSLICFSLSMESILFPQLLFAMFA